MLDSLTKSWGQLDGIVANIGNGKSVSDPYQTLHSGKKFGALTSGPPLHCENFHLSSQREYCFCFVCAESNLLTLQLIIQWQNPLISFAKNLSENRLTVVNVSTGNVYSKGHLGRKLRSDKIEVENMIENQCL